MSTNSTGTVIPTTWPVETALLFAVSPEVFLHLVVVETPDLVEIAAVVEEAECVNTDDPIVVICDGLEVAADSVDEDDIVV